jgi:hypothetical protein
MNPADDPLEAELAALTPRPRARARRRGVARRLGRTWWRPLLAGAVAAGLVLAWWFRPAPPPPSPPGPTPPAMALREEPPPPSLAFYRPALAGDSDSLDALLTEQAHRGGATAPPVTPVAIHRRGADLAP